MRGRLLLLTAVLANTASLPLCAAQPLTIVICAPGYPGSTAEAQTTMDLFAGALARTTGLASQTVAAVYFENEAAGLARLGEKDVALTIVPLPFYLAHAKALKLQARLQVVAKGGDGAEIWSLVAKKGRVANVAALAGWELVSLAAYVPAFVDRVALAGWGPLPSSVKLLHTGAVLSALRRAANGDNVALLLDAQQADAITKLPFAAEIETVHRSAQLPAAILCSVGARGKDPAVPKLLAALATFHARPEGPAVLDALRLARFIALDDKALSHARALFGGGS